MSYIYKITNNINQKIYIGKTAFSLEKRFNEHIKDSKGILKNDRPLYRAINKYGSENFSISLIEEVLDEDASIREKFWIEYYNSFKNGYNATLGGEGTFKLNHQEIIDMIKMKKSRAEIAEELNCSLDIITDIAKSNGLKNYSAYKRDTSKSLKQLSLNGEELRTFDSITQASQWLFDNNYALTQESARISIARVINNTRKTAYKFLWELI